MHQTDHSRRDFLQLLGSGFLFSLFTSIHCTSQKRKRPNIIMIIGDDIGFSDIGCYGSEIHTPNLDRLGENGIRFKQFYNMAKCNPTRSSLFTGLIEGDDRAISFVPLLKDSGYHTIMSGKEHFDTWVPQHCYAKNTFDQSFTFWATTEYFIPPSGQFEKPFILNGRELTPSEIKTKQNPFYKTDVITDYALDWLENVMDKEDPFFLYLPYHVAHYPLQARETDIQKYRGTYKEGWDVIRRERFERMKEIGVIDPDCALSPPSDNTNQFRGHPEGDEERRAKIPKYRPWESLSEREKDEFDLEMSVFAGMIDRMDQNIGRVLKKVEEAGRMENTLILFFSDNGSCPFDSNKDFNIPPGGPASYRCLNTSWANVGNTPFRYYKQNGHEGGCNTHFIAHWPGIIDRGTITDQPGHVVDLFTTILDLIGIDYPEQVQDKPTIPLHGQSLLPVFKGKIRKEPDFFISGFTERFRMFRQKNWKIVRVNNGKWELYNMEIDPTELYDLAQAMPVKLREMENDYRFTMAHLKR
ncbi:arylsulfatase [bacterium]|nr:arylsulfatase [bacterium]RQV92114.1 MAG: arylsulfatase [bacterium]